MIAVILLNFAARLVQKALAILSTNQIQNFNES